MFNLVRILLIIPLYVLTNISYADLWTMPLEITNFTQFTIYLDVGHGNKSPLILTASSVPPGGQMLIGNVTFTKDNKFDIKLLTSIADGKKNWQNSSLLSASGQWRGNTMYYNTVDSIPGYYDVNGIKGNIYTDISCSLYAGICINVSFQNDSSKK